MMKTEKSQLRQRIQRGLQSMKLAVTTAAVTALCAMAIRTASPAYAQSCGSWTPDGPNGPLSRSGQTMVFDSQLGAAYLFGGQRGGMELDDTWMIAIVDGSPSFLPLASGPSPRGWNSSAYDSGRGRMVLFGGYDDWFLGDTWELVGGTWLLASESGPEPRYATSDGL